MSTPRYSEYKKREFCNDVRCPVQNLMNKVKDNLDVYELVRQTCKSACRFSAWTFHHWLIEKGYLILKPKESEE